MKSRKLRAVFAALSAIAVLATAMTGFAATVTTTTEYHANDDYVHVVSTVTGANGDVTYLATTSDEYGVNSSGILYIDQKEVEDGIVTFDYMVAKDVINGAVTSLALGTNGTEAIEQPTDGLKIKAANTVDGEGYTITFAEDYYANGDDSVTAYVTAKPNYEIVSVTIGEDVYEPAASYIVPIRSNGNRQSIQVEVNQTYVTPSIEVYEHIYENDDKTVIAVFKPIGSYTEVGVEYCGYAFPAPMAGENGYSAVVLNDDVEIIKDKLSNYIK